MQEKITLPEYRIPPHLRKYFRAKLDNCYVCHIVEICRELKRVLRKDGTFWLNMGDSYNSKPSSSHSFRRDRKKVMPAKFNPVQSLKPKDLCEIPSDVARALRADGWWLRSRLPWLKRNSMPGSEKDRPSGSGSTVEYVFLLTKSKSYFYDNEAVKIPSSAKTHSRGNGINPKARKTPTGWDTGPGDHSQLKGRYPKSKQNASFSGAINKVVAMRNRRPSDWFFESWQGLYEEDGDPLAFVVNPQSFKEAHFATFPEKLVRPMILAGTKKGDIVLDPFSGSGTVPLVATKLGRNYIGIDLKQEYIDMAKERMKKYNEQTRLL